MTYILIFWLNYVECWFIKSVMNKESLITRLDLSLTVETIGSCSDRIYTELNSSCWVTSHTSWFKLAFKVSFFFFFFSNLMCRISTPGRELNQRCPGIIDESGRMQLEFIPLPVTRMSGELATKFQCLLVNDLSYMMTVLCLGNVQVNPVISSIDIKLSSSPITTQNSFFSCHRQLMPPLVGRWMFCCIMF